MVTRLRARRRTTCRLPRRSGIGVSIVISIRFHVTVTYVALGVDLHLRHCVVELHVFFADGTAILDSFDAFAQAVGLNNAFVDRGLRDPHD
jgi:hypothetical protein